MTFFFYFRDTTVVTPWDTTLQGHIPKYSANAISFIACSCTRLQALVLDHSSMVDAALRLKSLPTPGLEEGYFMSVLKKLLFDFLRKVVMDNCSGFNRVILTLALRRGRFRPWFLFICFISSKCVTKYQ